MVTVCDSAISANVLGASEWRAEAAEHHRRVDAWTAPHLERASRGERHPIHDFLFEYYSYRPAQLRRWHPGIGIALEDADEYLAVAFYRRDGAGVSADPALLKPERRAAVRWIRDLLSATERRAPFFGCAGLHEWAMVYRAPEVRHAAWPLRLERRGVDAVVESLPVRCTHYDAFRFFTAAARPLNRVQPDRPRIPELEQPGCLHANMDLYKWAYKLAPFAPSTLVADAFELARAIREVDMRASPYDLSALGFEPIRIESPDGRADYERHQRVFSEQARPIRTRLVSLCGAILDA